MNIKVANRLVELRKKSGLSQEQLADKLGLSRQAVSKWERAEASPDTDNLICLAKLYNVSLDELLSTDETIDEIAEETKERNEDKEKKESKKMTKMQFANAIVSAVLGGIVLILYLTLGFLYTDINFWAVGWTMFLLVPVVSSVFEAIDKKKFGCFALPLLIAAIYCFLGIQFGMWHPHWVMWLTIPIYYIAVDPIDKWLHKDEKKDKNPDNEK